MQTFLDLYVAHAGTTEIPAAYHKWACLSLLAACVEDRVFGMKHAATPLTPNLYVLLVGGPGIGRSHAIRMATRLAEPYWPRLNICWGRLTSQHLIDSLGLKQPTAAPESNGTYHAARQGLVDAGKLWVVADDMGVACAKRGSAPEFVTFMTGLYDGAPMSVDDKSGVFANVKIHSPCLNWLAGANRDWIIRHVTHESIHAGFFGQTVIVEASYDHDHRIAEPSYPADLDDIRAELQWRLGKVLSIKRALVPLAADARAWMTEWYDTRTQPETNALIPTWRRQQDMLYKVGILLAVSEWTGHAREWERPGSEVQPIIVRAWHLKEALAMLEDTYENVGDYVRSALLSPPESLVRVVGHELRTHGEMSHGELLRRVTNKHFTANQLHEAIQHLRAEGFVRKETRAGAQRGKKWYVWKGVADFIQEASTQA